MTASERLFVGMPEAHIAAFYEHLRIRRIERQRIRQVAACEWDALPDTKGGFAHARAHLAAMPVDRLAALNAEWDRALVEVGR